MLCSWEGSTSFINQGVFVARGTDKSQHAQFSAHFRLIIFNNTLVIASKIAFSERPSWSTCSPAVKPRWLKSYAL